MAASSTIRPSMGQALRACRPSIAPSRATTTSFLSAQRLQPAQIASFSTSSELMRRHTYDGARDNRDNSKHRGESTLRRTGTRWKLSVSDEPLPKPVPREELPRVETDPQHGLWEFFQDRTTVANTPAKDAQHGRAWTVEELRRKSWDDLHRLWWICVKERNRIATANIERRKSSLGFGDSEAQARDQQVRLTMRGIKHVLTERFYTWEDAVKLAEDDPEVDLSGEGTPFTPSEYLENEELDDVREEELTGEERKALEEARDSETREDKEHTAGQGQKSQGITELDPSTIPASKPNQDSPRA